MDFSPSPRSADLAGRVSAFVRERIEPAEVEMRAEVARRRASGEDTFALHPRLAELQQEARAEGLWNLFLPVGHDHPWAERFGTDGGAGLSNVDYAPVAEAMGRSYVAPLVFNCNAPDTGNMEVLLKYGSEAQQARWLEPLLDGRIRSAFLMTEPAVASSDATNMAATARIEGDEVVVDGRKWWSSGVGHPLCKVGIFMGLTDPEADRHHQHSMVVVPLDHPGVTIERILTALGATDEPIGHGQVLLEDVRLPIDHVIAGPGRAFEIAQGRLGPGRVHHCMRLIGLAEMALEAAVERATRREAFGKPLVNLGGNRERIAHARIAINQARLHVLHAAWKLDTHGARGALSEVAEIKASTPQMACDVIDMAIQLHGGAGMSADFPLAEAYAGARSLRLADGPDEVHLGTVAKLEIARQSAARAAREGANA